MRNFVEGVPWGVVRIEPVGSSGNIPQIDPLRSPVVADDQCVVAAVVHPDISPVTISVLGEGDANRGIPVFDGHMDTPHHAVVIADLVGDDFIHTIPVPGGRTRVRIFMDDPREAQHIEIRFA
ncbi:hypothetical protein [Streptomyces uncialis]|uniref:Uncharacterized protein n=1 Tax=Streptomyces uncialis TaxID=1048205 RepID=A0A1Q4V7U1_9ACTN|nr:hypothetical protein [Streptomyces uncialis]OKH93877.1 hypothetical protein AB852_14325 [Streptomyces uncialis]WTE08923.1 hypothetical protein OG924_00650 [Streptomyces uncialis]